MIAPQLLHRVTGCRIISYMLFALSLLCGANSFGGGLAEENISIRARFTSSG